MRSISCRQIAQEVLEQCISGNPPKLLPRVLVEEPCAPSLFGVLVEGLADRFEPALCDAYARLFSQAVAYAVPEVDPAALVARYERVRRPRALAGRPRRIFVLSRITLGADVAVTSVLLAAVKKRFRRAEIIFVGPKKNYELFAADPRIHHAPLEYRRGGLGARLAVWDELKTLLAAPDCLVIDPDSRVTQLGLLRVAAEERYHLFESRSYGAESASALPELAAAWAAETFGVDGVKPYIALGTAPKHSPYIAVSFGVGENPAKRIGGTFEEELLSLLAGTGLPLCIDRGAGGAEAARVEDAVKKSGVAATLWDGSFAGFASIIAGARLYAGYDSAGQHIAAAAGVPLISLFAGFPAPRMFDRWQPKGPNCKVIRIENGAVPAEIIERAKQALAEVPGLQRPSPTAKELRTTQASAPESAPPTS